MEKQTNQSSENFRLILIVMLCVMSFVAGAAYTKTDLWITKRYAPDIKPPIISALPVIEREARATPKQSSPTESAGLIAPLPQNKPESTPAVEPRPEPAGQWQTVRMRVTAYCPCPTCCGQYADGMTACGHIIEPGDTFVAADKRYPFGTKMIVPGYSHEQPVKVLDRGGAIKGDRIDLFFPTHQQALEWGVQYLDVIVHNE